MTTAPSATLGDPIVAPDDQWTWVDFPSSKCASGSPTGIGVNPHAGSRDLVVFLEGGGFCTDAASCWGPEPGAVRLTGYDAATFGSEPRVDYPLLVRSLASNPMAAMSFVFVPYCTGDMHAGARALDMQMDGGPTIPTYFWGATDLDVFLARLVPTFPEVTHVWLLGTSAGGFGAMLELDRFARAFAGARVDVIDDSGPPIPLAGDTGNTTLFDAWGYAPPDGCAGCDSLRAVYDFDRHEQPSSRYAFLSFTRDDVVSARFGYTLGEFPAILTAFSSSIAGDPNAATFLVTDEASHVVESDLTLVPYYMPWIAEMVADAPVSDETFAYP